MKTPSRIKSLSILAVRVFLGFLFLYASLDKIFSPGAFAETVYNYRIIPEGMIHIFAVVLPWLELLLGLLLIVDLWLPGAVLVANALLMMFLGAIVFNIARGLNIDCGCFSSSGSSSSMFYYLIRDAFFLILSLCAGIFVLTARTAPEVLSKKQKLQLS
jgi:uncharacterized membrane protein YphA (DoxX/SURF4 family)